MSISAKNALTGVGTTFENKRVFFLENSDPCLPYVNVDKFWSQLAIHGIIKNALVHGGSTKTKSVKVLIYTSISKVRDQPALKCVFNSDGEGFPEDLISSWNSSSEIIQSIRSTSENGSGVGLLMSRSFLARQEIDFSMELSNGGPLGGAMVQLFLPIARTIPNAPPQPRFTDCINSAIRNCKSWALKFRIEDKSEMLRNNFSELSDFQVHVDSYAILVFILSVIMRNQLRDKVKGFKYSFFKEGTHWFKGKLRSGTHVHAVRDINLPHNCPTECLSLLNLLCHDSAFTVSSPDQSGFREFVLKVKPL